MESTDQGPRIDPRPTRREPSPRAPAPPEGPDLRALALGAEQRLGQRVVGQAPAVASVARALRRAAAGLASRGPHATLLFVGPTGTGKTELARVLADELGGPRRLLRVDCGEFGSGHEASKILGAPPGYVGHERGGVFGKRGKDAGECVLLFDEIEKAHPRVHELLLQVLDEGRLTDGRGTELDFRRAFVILTSNAGTRELLAARERLGFGSESLAEEAARGTVQCALEAAFAPEFLARLDEIVLFRELGPQGLREVATRQLLDLAVRVRARAKRVCFSTAVARWAAARASTGKQGARGLVHLLRREIEAPLAEALLGAGDGEWIEVSIRRRRPHFVHVA